jgi:hypothetical protein
MTTIRKFVYATLLALITLNLAPSLARAQEPVRGKFTLPHEVRWQEAVLPAGEYRFSFDPGSTGSILMLSKLSGEREEFMLVVQDTLVQSTEEAKPHEQNRLVLDDTAESSYVSAMQLPEFGMTLKFAAPAHVAEKQVARASSAPPGAAQ